MTDPNHGHIVAILYRPNRTALQKLAVGRPRHDLAAEGDIFHCGTPEKDPPSYSAPSFSPNFLRAYCDLAKTWLYLFSQRLTTETLDENEVTMPEREVGAEPRWAPPTVAF